MRITRETLLRIAKETALKRALSEPSLTAAYLTGSLLTNDPFLGGSTDIDLVLIHAEAPKVRREVTALTPEVHLDIVHMQRSDYKNPKELRTHPTLGSELYNPLWLFETQHFLEFVQAAVRTRFNDPDNVLERARRNSQEARRLWLELQADLPAGPGRLHQFLLAAGRAADAIAVLNGSPLTERRFLLQFPARAVAADRADLAGRLTSLLGGEHAEAVSLEAFLPEWEKEFLDAASRPGVHVSIAAARLLYYKGAFQALLGGDMPQAVLWPMLHTWTLAAESQPITRQSKWAEFCELLGLGADGFNARLHELDLFLDDVEALLDGLGASMG